MEMTPVESKAINAVGYDPETRTMGIEFHSGRVHHYPDTLPHEHEALMSAGSIGKHFNQFHRDRQNTRVK